MKNVASVCHDEGQYCTGKSKRTSPQRIPAVSRTHRRRSPVARNILGQQTHAELLPAFQCVTTSLSEYFRLAKGKSGCACELRRRWHKVRNESSSNAGRVQGLELWTALLQEIRSKNRKAGCNNSKDTVRRWCQVLGAAHQHRYIKQRHRINRPY